MKVSVCIPTYNSAEFLRECIESVLSQTYHDFEINISDDASTDTTCDIVRSFSDPRIRLDRAERNGGLAANFNRAARMARGDYFKILCADDVLESSCLEKQVDLLERYPESTMSTAGLLYIDECGKTLRNVSWLFHETLLAEADVIAGTLIYGNIIGHPSAVLIRRASFLKAGPFSENLPQALDLELWLRLLDLGPVGYYPTPLCGFRLHPNTMTQKQRRAGVIRSDIQRITDMMLQRVIAGPAARRVCWGRVAGSFLKQMFAGLRHGYLKWPLAALWQAVRIDPAFLGLIMHQLLFSPGVLGLRVEAGRVLRVRFGNTLRT